MILNIRRQLTAVLAAVISVTALTLVVTARNESTPEAIGCQSGTHWDNLLNVCR